jgi:hypothetical protein
LSRYQTAVSSATLQPDAQQLLCAVRLSRLADELHRYGLKLADHDLAIAAYQASLINGEKRHYQCMVHATSNVLWQRLTCTHVLFCKRRRNGRKCEKLSRLVQKHRCGLSCGAKIYQCASFEIECLHSYLAGSQNLLDCVPMVRLSLVKSKRSL